MKKTGLVLLVLMALLCRTAGAEIIRIGKTPCLLNPAEQEDRMRRYVYFAGSGDYFHAVQNCADYTASDGMLLVPQGDGRFSTCTAASDVVIRDLKPQVLQWAQEGNEIILVGFSAGGYPATALAVYLAGEGYTGQLVILDGIIRAYRGIHYNAAYYREKLPTWQMTFCASSSQDVRIAEATRQVGEEMRDDGNVTYLPYILSHNAMRSLYPYIFEGMQLPDPEFREQ